MQAQTPTWPHTTAAITLFVMIGCLDSAHAADPACAPVFEAMEKLATTPSHTYSTETASFRKVPLAGEVIITSNTIYVMANGNLRQRSFDAQKNLRDMQDADRNANVACKYLRDEVMDSEAAALYSTHNVTEFGTSDQQVWISKSRGLPLRQTIDISEGHAHHEVRYDYANVQPPANAQ